MPHQQSQCIACKIPTKKYKCPTCHSNYCSLQCSKIHKSFCFKPTASDDSKKDHFTEDPDIIKTNFIQDQQMRISDYRLRQLKKNEQLKKLLSNPELRAALLKIDNSKERITELQRAMQDQKFMHFADLVLATVAPQQ